MQRANSISNRTTNAAILTALHFLVDAICVCSLYLAADAMDVGLLIGCFVLYNVVAFGTQPIVGCWIDRFKYPAFLLVLSDITLIAGGICTTSYVGSQSSALAIFGVVSLGIGNSLFHVYAGKYVTISWKNDICVLGIFVSTGAVGLSIGSCFSSNGLLIGLLSAVVILSIWHLMIYCRGLLVQIQPFQIRESDSNLTSSSTVSVTTPNHTLSSLTSVSSTALWFVLFMMFIVAGRSFIGTVTPPVGNKAPIMLIMMSVVAMVGKASGGFVTLIFGLRKTLVWSLILASVCLLVCKYQLVLIPVTVFLINLSMPCTLFLANRSMPTREGTAFGLLAAALLPGYYIGSYCASHGLYSQLVDPLLGTMLIEGLLLLYMRESRWQVYAAMLMMNILTNVPLNLIALSHHLSLWMILLLEAGVIIIEFFLYWAVIKNKKTAFMYSVILNVTSYLVGVILQLLL